MKQVQVIDKHSTERTTANFSPVSSEKTTFFEGDLKEKDGINHHNENNGSAQGPGHRVQDTDK